MPRNGMQALHYQQCWAITSALIAMGPNRYRKFLELVKKEHLSQIQALEKAYGTGLANIEAAWKNHAVRRK
jgi:hypothetical protein